MKTLRNLKFQEIKSNAGGIRSISFVAKKSDIATMPDFPDAPDSATAAVTLEGDITMVSGKTFVEMYTRKGTGKCSFEATGPEDGKYYNTKGELDYPDIDDDAVAMAADIINTDLVAIIGTRVSNSNKFKFVVLGGDMFPCSCTATGDTGTTDSPDKYTKFEFNSSDTVPLKRYTGTIKLEGGTFDCDTGVFTATAV